jgi:hypothetical protein
VEGKHFKRIANQEKHFIWLVQQAKLKSFQRAPKYKFAYQIPHTYEEALRFDEINCSTKWADAMELEMLQLNDYKCFINMGIYNCDPIPEGYKKIQVHLVYDIKHNGHQ